jgi:hypothetical protein
VPAAIYIFFMRDGANWLGGGAALIFICGVFYFANRQHQIVARRLKVELENEELLARSLRIKTSKGVTMPVASSSDSGKRVSFNSMPTYSAGPTTQ